MNIGFTKNLFMSLNLATFIFAYSAYCKSKNISFFFIFNGFAFLSMITTRYKQIFAYKVLCYFPIALIDYFLVRSLFSNFVNASFVELALFIIYFKILFLKNDGEFNSYKYLIFLSCAFSFGYFNMLVSTTKGTRDFQTNIFTIFVILFRYSLVDFNLALCLERFFNMFLILIFDGFFHYNDILLEIAEIKYVFNIPTGLSIKEILLFISFGSYIIFVNLIPVTAEFTASSIVSFTGFIIFLATMSYYTDYSYLPLWIHSEYSILLNLIVLLVFILVQMICVIALDAIAKIEVVEESDTGSQTESTETTSSGNEAM